MSVPPFVCSDNFFLCFSDKSCLKIGDLEWYFFCPIEKKYGSGARMNRATEIGYWKATGKDRAVLQNNQTVGMIKTLIFHTGKAPRGERTDWVMHEYRLEDKDLADKGIAQVSIFSLVYYVLLAKFMSFFMEIYVSVSFELMDVWQFYRICAFVCECM